MTRLAGGASPRTYWRATLHDGTAAVVMALPDDPMRSDEHAAAATQAELPWLTMQRALAARGIPVPAVLRADVAAGYLLIEDLGDTRLFDQVTGQVAGQVTGRVTGAAGTARLRAYEEARALCDQFGAATADLEVAARFDRAHITAELAEFQAMGLEARLAMTLGPAARAMLATAFADLTDRLVAMPTRLAHRDFQSQNLMVTPRGLVVVDFQDAFMAPFVYDLVALLRDSYVRLDASELAALLAPYSAATREAFGVQTIQRKLKDAGRFVTLANKGKPEYLPFFGDTIGYVVEALVTTGLYPELLALLVELLPEARQALGP